MAQSNQIDSSIYAKAQENPEQSIAVMMRISKQGFRFHEHLPSNEPNNLRLSVFTEEINQYIASFHLSVVIEEYFSNLCVFALKGKAQDILHIGQQDSIIGVELLAENQ